MAHEEDLVAAENQRHRQFHKGGTFPRAEIKEHSQSLLKLRWASMLLHGRTNWILHNSEIDVSKSTGRLKSSCIFFLLPKSTSTSNWLLSLTGFERGRTSSSFHPKLSAERRSTPKVWRQSLITIRIRERLRSLYRRRSTCFKFTISPEPISGKVPYGLRFEQKKMQLQRKTADVKLPYVR